jgi:hypothetical protein
MSDQDRGTSDGATTAQWYRAASRLQAAKRDGSFMNCCLSSLSSASLDPTCSVVSDGLQCFGSVADGRRPDHSYALSASEIG